MVVNSLTQTARQRLQHLLLKTPCIVAVTMATRQLYRHYQDDNRQRKQSSASERKNVKAREPTISLLKMDQQDILCGPQKQQKVQLVNSFKHHMDHLQPLGCSVEKMKNYEEVLNLTEQNIQRHAADLMELGYSPATVKCLLDALQSKIADIRKDFLCRDDVDQALCSVLQCSPCELSQIKKDHPQLHKATSEELFQKAEILRSYGITTEEIRALPDILAVEITQLQERLSEIQGLQEQGKFEEYPLSIIAETNTWLYSNYIQKAVKVPIQQNEIPVTFETVAKKLGVTVKDVKDASINFKKFSLPTVMKKIDILLKNGIPGPDIVSHIHITKYSQDKIKWAVEKSKSVSTRESRMYTILSFLCSGHLPNKKFAGNRQWSYIASLLGKNLPSSPFLSPLWSCDRLKIKQNFDFLISEGYSVEDISSCLILLAHDSDCLQSYYRELWSRPDVAAYVKKEDCKDPKQILSLLQYVIEKDMNFTSLAFFTDVECTEMSEDTATLEEVEVEESH